MVNGYHISYDDLNNKAEILVATKKGYKKYEEKNIMLEWLKENYDNICVVITAIITFCSVVVKVTPTDKDDKILSKIIAILDTFFYL